MTVPGRPLLDQYRQAMTHIGAHDEVAVTDQRVEELWARAVAAADLNGQEYVSVPGTVAPDRAAPPGLDTASVLDRIARSLAGGAPQDMTSARRIGLVWLGCCLLAGVLLGATVSGLMAVPAIGCALVTGGLLLLFGPGRVPGWIWSIGLIPLTFLLTSGSTPSTHSSTHVPAQWFVGVVFLLLVSGFGVVLGLAGSQRLHTRAAGGRRVTRMAGVAAARRPLELEIVLCTLGASLAGQDGVLILLPSLVGLLRRRWWTPLLGLAGTTLMLAVALRDASMTAAPEQAHVVVLAALAVHWLRALLSKPWRSRLTATEAAFSLAGWAVRTGYGASRQAIDNQVAFAMRPLCSPPAAPPRPQRKPQPQQKKSKYPDGQFGRYCASCAYVTPHVSRGGFSVPQCIPCGSRSIGGTGKDRTHNHYCTTCNSTTPHTKKGCVVCGH